MSQHGNPSASSTAVTITSNLFLALAGGVLLLAPTKASADLPTCVTPVPQLYAPATLVRDPGLDVSPQTGCPTCTTPCTPGGSYCYDCWDTVSGGGVDYCCYDYQPTKAGYESCGVNLDWYAQTDDLNPFSTDIFPNLELRVAGVTGGSSRVACVDTSSQACKASSSASHCTVMQFTYSPIATQTPNWFQKDFTLFGVSDCTSSVPFRKRLVAEHRERHVTPQGSITASPTRCVHDQVDGTSGEPYCTTTVSWETTNVTQPNVVVYVRDNGAAPLWSPPIPWKCKPANTPFTFAASTVKITDADGVTFELWPTTSNCGNPWPSYPASGSPLDTVVVTSEPEGTVLCPLDEQPMRQGVDIGIITNGIEFACVFHDLGAQECYQAVAEKLAAIGVKYHRLSIEWDKLYPQPHDCNNPPPSSLTFNRYDPIMEAFSDAGIEGWVTFDQVPCWYSSKPDPFPSGCTDHPLDTYPPDPEDSTAWAAWLDYVEEVYDRYGPSEDTILEVPVRNWEAWLEPNSGFMNIDPVSCPPPEGQNGDHHAKYAAWEELQRSVYETIGELEGNPGGPPTESEMWSANLVLLWASFASYVVPPWFDTQMDTIGDEEMFTGFNLHTFVRDFTNSANPNRESSLESMVQMLKYSRARLNAAGGSALPIALTATTWHVPPEDPWEFVRELPDDEDRAQFLKDVFACQANAGADKIFWFNATDLGSTCGPPKQSCADFADPDCVSHGLGLLRVEGEDLIETPLYCAFADLCRHLDGCTVAAGVCE
jgi:hypothetical protein